MYALVYQNQVQVGPRDWYYWAFKSFLDSNNLDSSALPINDPGAAVVTDAWWILPVVTVVPSTDPFFEQLAGPTLTINSATNVVAEYTAAPQLIEIAKGSMMSVVTSNRYIAENQGTTATLSDTTVVSLYTDRTNRGVYQQILYTLADGATVNVKFADGTFKTIPKTDLQTVVNTVNQWVQSTFDWEYQTYAQISTATTQTELQAIPLQNSAWVSPTPTLPGA